MSRLLGSAVSVAVHSLVAVLLLLPADLTVRATRAVGPQARAGRSPAPLTRSGVEIFVVEEPERGEAPGLKAFSSGQELFEYTGSTDSTAVPLPGFTFDFKKVLDRSSLLFPIVSPGLSLDAFGLLPAPKRSRRLSNPLTAGGARTSTPPLALNERSLQTIIDASWSRRDRWIVFDEMQALAAAHDAQDGALPALFQRYVQQNALQPYADTTIRDARLWAQLGLAADHVAFIGFVSSYTSRNPGTKTATELLFLLDKIVQASYDCLITLLDTAPSADLTWTYRQNRDAYLFIEQIQRFYRAQLERQRIDSPDALRAYYDKVRLSILTALLHTTPDSYRSGDARYLIGAIHWRHGNRTGAIDTWRDITVDRSDSYVTAYSDVLEAIGADGDAADSSLRRQVERALDAERGRWRDFSYTRLRQFGYRFDTY
jgi:hypothetical protein